MRRFLVATGTALLAVSLVMTGNPAQAGSMSWEDAAGDPTTLAQATLDITKVTLNFDGNTFSSTLDIAQLGEPAPFGTGQWFSFRFNFGEGVYTFRVTQDRFTGDNFQFQQKVGESTVEAIACKTCKFKLDFEASQVYMEIAFESLKSSLRKLGPGQSIEALSAFSGPVYSDPSGVVGGTVFSGPNLLWAGNPGDSAPHPEGASFTF